MKSILSLLTVLFIGLKLTSHITWSWWWVLAPTWIPAAMGIVVLIGLGIAFDWDIHAIKKWMAS